MIDCLRQSNRIPLIITAIIFISNPPWFLWSCFSILEWICIAYLLYEISGRIPKLSYSVNAAIVFLLIPVFILLPIFRGWHGSGIVYTLCFLAATLITEQEFHKSLQYITRVFTIIIAISLPLWLFHVFVHTLTPFSYMDITSMKGTETHMENYILFVAYSGIDYFRFYSIFDEPGVVGTLGAFILYANKYDFSRWESWIILLGCFFSYSMAFILLTLIGFGIISIKKKRQAIFAIILLVPVFIGLFQFLKDDLAFNNAVLGRLFESDTSELVENRTSLMVNKTFEEMMSSSDMVFGYGDNLIISKGIRQGASYKLFILEYGIIGLVAMLILYRILMKGHNTLYAWGAYILVFISFLQRPQIWTDKNMLMFCCMIAGVTIAQGALENKNSIGCK